MEATVTIQQLFGRMEQAANFKVKIKPWIFRPWLLLAKGVASQQINSTSNSSPKTYPDFRSFPPKNVAC